MAKESDQHSDPLGDQIGKAVNDLLTFKIRFNSPSRLRRDFDLHGFIEDVMNSEHVDFFENDFKSAVTRAGITYLNRYGERNKVKRINFDTFEEPIMVESEETREKDGVTSSWKKQIEWAEKELEQFTELTMVDYEEAMFTHLCQANIEQKRMWAGVKKNNK